MDTIKEFRGPYRFLSNFYPAEVSFAGFLYPSVENAYQAAKSADRAFQESLIAMTPGQAKRAGRGAVLISNWESIKQPVMAELLLQKFMHADLWARLDATGDAVLKEVNTWGDRYWGMDLATGRGQNILGKMLMTIRKWIRTHEVGMQALWYLERPGGYSIIDAPASIAPGTVVQGRWDTVVKAVAPGTLDVLAPEDAGPWRRMFSLFSEESGYREGHGRTDLCLAFGVPRVPARE
jgi:hypothetical protein